MKKEPILWGSLLARVLILGFILLTGHWRSGDTHHYIWIAGEACAGNWGGVPGRPNMYAWFLCALSPSLKAGAGAASTLWLPLAAQSFLIWLSGYALWRSFPKIRSRRLIAAMFLFDPVLLVFSGLVMSDGLFAVIMFGLGLVGWKLFNERKEPRALALSALFGALLGASLLTRAVGFPVIVWTLAFWCVFQLKKLHRVAVAAIVMLIVLAPQSYWNRTHHGTWSLFQQSGWIHTVASAVEYHERGLDFYEAEAQWAKEDRFSDPRAPMETIKRKLATFVYLSAKGVARVLIGHVNVEWGSVMIGTAPVGPGWFKVPEKRQGPHVSGLVVLPWLLGLLLTASLSLYAYWRTVRAWLAAGWRDTFSLWIIGCIGLLAATPLVWGDARFRAPIWPLVLLLWATSEERKRARR